MAQKTVIIRPSTESNITDASTPQITTFPANESVLNVIGESTPDDDATYIKFAGSTGYVDLHFDIDQAHWRVAPTNIRVIFRFKCANAKSGLELQYNDTTIGVYYPDNLSTYQTVTVDIADTLIEQMWSFNGGDKSIVLRIIGCLDSVDLKTSVEAYVTQAYLEYDYSYDEAVIESIYLKRSEVWELLTGTIYQKRSGAWTGHATNKFYEDIKLYVVILDN